MAEGKITGVIYLGPGDFVNVEPYGRHNKDAVIDYPESFAEELIETSKKQQFKISGKKSASKKEEDK